MLQGSSSRGQGTGLPQEVWAVDETYIELLRSIAAMGNVKKGANQALALD